MGLLDKIKGMIGGNADKVKDGVDKAGDMVDEKTGGKFSDEVGDGRREDRRGPRQLR